MKKIKTIYIVDDDGLYTLLLKKKIEKLNICNIILSFKNGEEAIADLRVQIEEQDHLPDIILLDINMPVMNGWEFMDEFSKMSSKLPKEVDIYICSSSIASEDRVRAEANKAIKKYLTKPIETETLLRIAQLH